MTRFWKRLNGSNELEGRLRRERPAPPRELVDDLVARIEADSAPASRARPRIALVSLVTAVTLFAFGATGGLGYAKSAATDAVSSTAHAFQAVVTKQPQKNNQSHPAGHQGQGSRPSQSQYREKVIICHKGHTISVAAPAVPAHLRHGDTLGPCS